MAAADLGGGVSAVVRFGSGCSILVVQFGSGGVRWWNDFVVVVMRFWWRRCFVCVSRESLLCVLWERVLWGGVLWEYLFVWWVFMVLLVWNFFSLGIWLGVFKFRLGSWCWMDKIFKIVKGNFGIIESSVFTHWLIDHTPFIIS